MQTIDNHHHDRRRRLCRYGSVGFLLLSALATLGVVLDFLFPPDLTRYQQRSALVLDADGELLRGFTASDGIWRLALTSDRVEPLFIEMLIAYEDRRFNHHPGVDPLAILRALAQWLQAGRIISGASTLTMQTAKLLEPRPRTLRNKIVEMLRALQLEWHYSKDQILSIYLTLAPYGGNLEGLRAASLAYLGKEPKELTAAEAALFVVIPQAPSKLRPDRFPGAAQNARDKVLMRMATLGILSPRQAQEAVQDNVPMTRQTMPFLAAHLARHLTAAAPKHTIHRTFIHGDLQRMLETMAQRQPLAAHASLAILVAENRSRHVIAYLGSADFFASQRAGQVDMVRAVRSPGSTLKPVVYGLAFDDLIVHPETLIDDKPTRFGDYAPTNFRNTFRGEVSVREALQRSLNVPAVMVLDQVGPVRIAARLSEAGITLHWADPNTKPGLPLVLGGVGLSLEDLVTLYAGFANGGIVAPLRYSQTTAPEQLAEHRLLGETASWYLKHILEGIPPPDAIVAVDNTRKPRPIAYKTGTSYGFRDAWALGFDDAFTVGVWIGRPDGSPNPGHYGRNSAAPLLFRVFDLLPQSNLYAPSAIPDGAILATHDQLPDRLKYLSRSAVSHASTAPALTITFPLADSIIELTRRNGRLSDLPLLASGGQKPLRWLVNGVPIRSSSVRRKVSWSPDGAGFTNITVIDAKGQTASVDVWVEENEADIDG